MYTWYILRRLPLKCQLIFIGKHSIATIDIAPRKWLWSLSFKSLTYMELVSTERVIPGLCQPVSRIVHPIRSGDSVFLTEVLNRSNTKNSPTLILRRQVLRL